MTELSTIKEASVWASEHLNKNVTTSNISYLVQYGKVKKYGNNGTTAINKYDLINYYKSFNGQRETDWREKLGEDLNWTLSFDNLKEKEFSKTFNKLQDKYQLKIKQDKSSNFLVANDKYNMYPSIAEKFGMKIVNQYKRPVLNRTEKNKSAYAEIIYKEVA
jgi:hypothetical protein